MHRVPAAQFMAAVPFGMTQKGMWAWLYGGDGLALWREIYAPFGVVPLPMGNSGTQMGGWFNRRIDSIADLEGLKMRIPGLGGKVLAKAGGNPVLLSAAEIYTALERGTIDATEWVGPLHDVRFGLDRAAKYYYYPGWQEPGATLEAIVNKEAWEALPEDLQKIVETACLAASHTMLAEINARNAEALRELQEEHGVEVLPFPDDVLSELRAASDEVITELAERDEFAARVWESYRPFRDTMAANTRIGDAAQLGARGILPASGT